MRKRKNMPSTITHAYIGTETLKKLHIAPKKMIQKHFDNYQIYCQNMDVLYFYKILLLKENKIQKIGHLFHTEKVFDAFNIMIQDNKQNQDEELFTFIAGLIVHYKTDAIMHPFIDYLAHSKKRLDQINKHFEIETYFDNYLVNKNNHNYQKTNNSQSIFHYTKEKIIEEEITKVFNTLFGAKEIGKKYYRALKEMKFVFQHLRYDKRGIKKRLYQIIDKNPFHIRKTGYLSYHFPLDKDQYLNLHHDTWFNYQDKNKTSNKSFFDLYDEVINSSKEIINLLYQYIFENKEIDLEKIIGNNSYSTGLPISPK